MLELARITDDVKKITAMGWWDPMFCTILPCDSYASERIDSFLKNCDKGR